MMTTTIQGVKRLRFFNSKIIAFLLVFFLVFHIGATGVLGSQQASASFLDEHKGSILTVIKGMVMLWIINLMRENIGGSDNEDILTSTIKKGLNIGSGSNAAANTDDNSTINNEQNDVIINNEYVTDEEFEMLKLVNQLRQEQGLNLLELDMELTSVARKKAIDMINNNYFDHNSPTYGTPFDMIKNYDIEYSLAGENLADSRSIEEAFQYLLDSPEHRENIIKSRYDRVGNGVVKKKDGGFMIVQLFVDSPDPSK